MIQAMDWHRVRELFDVYGEIAHPVCTTPFCKITYKSSDVLQQIAQFCGIPYEIINDTLNYTGTNCIDFLGNIYKYCTKYNLQGYDKKKYNRFSEWLMPEGMPQCQVFKTDPNAIFPTKSKISDTGYDLTIIKEEKKWLNNITLYDTGIKIQVEQGYYAEVIPRSSLSKSGYMLANSVGIIDQGYNGNLYIALVKVDPSAPDIELPFRCCQLVFREQIHVEMQEVMNDFSETARGSGGFGSTAT